MERILTEEQIVLKEYFKEVGMSTISGMKILSWLWDEEATMEMLKYIIDTEEKDPAVLSSVALRISKKYETEENPD